MLSGITKEDEMTDEQWKELAPFAAAMVKARNSYEDHTQMNIPVELRAFVEAKIAIEKAKIELQQAEAAFEAAKKRILGL